MIAWCRMSKVTAKPVGIAGKRRWSLELAERPWL